jgi:hypothetical protein
MKSYWSHFPASKGSIVPPLLSASRVLISCGWVLLSCTHKGSTAPCSILLYSSPSDSWVIRKAPSTAQAGSGHSCSVGHQKEQAQPTLLLCIQLLPLCNATQCLEAHCRVQEDSMLHSSASARRTAPPLHRGSVCFTVPNWGSLVSCHRAGAPSPPLGKGRW